MRRGWTKTDSWKIGLAVFFVLAITPSSRAAALRAAIDVLLPPVASSPYYPCSTCHAPGEVTASPGMKPHGPVQVSGHTEKEYTCHGCHDSADLDRLKLFNGSEVDLLRSSKLCGQCHSTNYALWESGLHGKVTGRWDRPGRITPCTTCHDPHRPGYSPHAAEPPPVPPEKTLRWRK